LGATT
jgi:hypothetical protein